MELCSLGVSWFSKVHVCLLSHGKFCNMFICIICTRMINFKNSLFQNSALASSEIDETLSCSSHDNIISFISFMHGGNLQDFISIFLDLFFADILLFETSSSSLDSDCNLSDLSYGEVSNFCFVLNIWGFVMLLVRKCLCQNFNLTHINCVKLNMFMKLNWTIYLMCFHNLFGYCSFFLGYSSKCKQLHWQKMYLVWMTKAIMALHSKFFHIC